MRFVVTKNFQDKFTREYYGIGSIYQTEDEDRSADLENGGYIAPDNTEAAGVAKASKAAQEKTEAPEVQATSKAAQEKTEAAQKVQNVKHQSGYGFQSEHNKQQNNFEGEAAQVKGRNQAKANKKDTAAE